jgi:hypothetical protein
MKMKLISQSRELLLSGATDGICSADVEASNCQQPFRALIPGTA